MPTSLRRRASSEASTETSAEAIDPDGTVYYWDRERTDSNGRPISGEGNVRYKYELRHQMLAV
jgi:hypothetical protein